MAHPCIRMILPLREHFCHLRYRNSYPTSPRTLLLHSHRHASSASPSKPHTLEKPAKFNPPSHPARLNRAPPRQYPGPPLSKPELKAQKTKQYPHMMPPEDSISQYIEVYKLHTARISEETAERRRKKVEDVQKRSHYRKAHGLDKEQGWGGWTAKKDNELLGPALRTDGAIESEVSRPPSSADGAPRAVETYEAVHMDLEGRKKPIKKWLGIW
ncbi:MAG: hypothetical protein Q9187_003467 [Circinaria calcarea]